jgi:23S rRNA pseudouridine955/2504/2580 synthase
LHSAITKINHPLSQAKLELIAPLPVELNQFLQKLEAISLEIIKLETKS